MGTIEITTEPHELIINGDTILMQGDPSAGTHWSVLLDLEMAYKTQAERDAVAKQIIDALVGMAETPEDGKKLKAMGLGIVTLRRVAMGYVEAVTGFPTGLSSSSKKP